MLLIVYKVSVMQGENVLEICYTTNIVPIVNNMILCTLKYVQRIVLMLNVLITKQTKKQNH